MNIYFCSFLIVGCLGLSKDPAPSVIPGDVSIGVLAQLRQDSSGECVGPIKSWAFQEVAAMEWALDTINNQTKQDFSVGLKVYDNCGNKDRLSRQSVNLLKNIHESTNPLIGIISLGDLPSIKTVASLLHAYSLPLVTIQAPSEIILKDENVFTTAPHLHANMKAVLSVVNRQKSQSGIIEDERRLGVISECHSALQVLENMAEETGVEVHSRMLIDATNKTKLAQDAEAFLKSQVGFRGTVILLLHTSSMNHLIENLDPLLVKRAESFWIFSVLDGEPVENTLNFLKISESFHMSAIIKPYSPLLSGLRLHLANALIGNTSIISNLLDQIRSPKMCSNEINFGLKNCKEAKTFPMLSGTRATSVIKAISTLVAAFRLVQIDRCSNNVKCLTHFEGEIGQDMVQSLMKLSYAARETSDNIRYTSDGGFVTSFVIYRVHPSGLQQVGKYTDEDSGIIWTHSLPGMRLTPTKLDARNPEDEQLQTFSVEDQPSLKSDDLIEYEEFPEDTGILQEIYNSPEGTFHMITAALILAWASAGIISTACVGVYLTVKTWHRPLTSSKVLERILLLGVISCFLSCTLFACPPTLAICRLRAMMPPISLSICLTAMVLKTIQRRHLVTSEIVREVSKKYIFLSLMIVIGLQITLSETSQKNILGEKSSSPLVELISNGIRMCRSDSFPSVIVQESLLILLAFSNVMINILEMNRNEEDLPFLMVSIIATVVIVMSTVILINMKAAVTSMCATCLTIATSFLIIIFILKIRQLRNEEILKHKKLHTSSKSNLFKHAENGNSIQTLSPPPPFCDPPCLRGYQFYDISTFKLDHSIPPPPPPPIKTYCL